MATKRQRRKRKQRAVKGAPPRSPARLPSGTRRVPPSGTRAGTDRVTDAGRRTGAPPAAPWGSFPLSEIVIAIALVLLIGGFIVPPPRGAVMLGAGLVLGSLAGLELSIREHFAGYKSHTMLLAGAAGIAALGLLFVVGPRDLAPAAKVAAAIAVFALAVWGLTGAFRRRSGGALFKTRA